MGKQIIFSCDRCSKKSVESLTEEAPRGWVHFSVVRGVMFSPIAPKVYCRECSGLIADAMCIDIGRY